MLEKLLPLVLATGCAVGTVQRNGKECHVYHAIVPDLSGTVVPVPMIRGSVYNKNDASSISLGSHYSDELGLGVSANGASISMNGGVAAGVSGLRLSPDGVTTPLLGWEFSGAIATPSKVLLPVYAGFKIPEFLTNPKHALRQILLRDLLPIYALQNVWDTSSRFFEGEVDTPSGSVEAQLHEARTARTNPRRLDLLESLLEEHKNDMSYGDIVVAYDRAMMREHLAFSKMDVAGGSVYDNVAANIEKSIHDLDESENDVEFISRLYHVSQLANVRILNDTGCNVTPHGKYLWVVDREPHLLKDLPALISRYASTTNALNTSLANRFITALESIKSPDTFRAEFNAFSRAYRYTQSIDTNLTKGVRNLALYLEAKGMPTEDLLTASAQLAQTLENNRVSFTDAPYVLSGLSDVMQETIEFPDMCDIPDITEDPMYTNMQDIFARYVAGDEIASRYESKDNSAFKQRARSYREIILPTFDAHLARHVAANPRAFAHYARKARGDFADAKRIFWTTIPDVEIQDDEKATKLARIQDGTIDDMRYVLDHVIAPDENGQNEDLKKQYGILQRSLANAVVNNKLGTYVHKSGISSVVTCGTIDSPI
ncbi:TPA: hypothetical protein HA278_06170 [Candidatus Woesearchaeota archaeon]|nr:hypothetical protein [archaeon]HIJ11617.1 hypothetical protein [Candidatus Woesearchaeota archaeon]